MYQGFIYFDRKNNYPVDSSRGWDEMYDHEEGQRLRERYTRKKNFIFKDRLQLHRAYATSGIWFKSLNNNIEYRMFTSDLKKLFEITHAGIIEGTFTFRKSGRRVGIVVYPIEIVDYTLKLNSAQYPIQYGMVGNVRTVLSSGG